MLLGFQWHIEKLSLEMPLGPGFVTTSPLNNNTNNRKLECDQTSKTAKMLMRRKISKQRCFAAIMEL